MFVILQRQRFPHSSASTLATIARPSYSSAKRIDDGSHHLARTAPGRPEVHEDELSGINDFVKTRFIDMKQVFYSSKNSSLILRRKNSYLSPVVYGIYKNRRNFSLTPAVTGVSGRIAPAADDGRSRREPFAESIPGLWERTYDLDGQKAEWLLWNIHPRQLT